MDEIIGWPFSSWIIMEADPYSQSSPTPLKGSWIGWIGKSKTVQRISKKE